MKTYTYFLTGSMLCFFACKNRQETINPASLRPRVVAAKGHVVSLDSMPKPRVVPAGNPIVVQAEKPKAVFLNSNIHPAGTPRVVPAGIPRECIPGQGGFSFPKDIPSIEIPFTPEITEVVAREASTKDQNSMNFSSFGKLQGLISNDILSMLEDKRGNLWVSTNGAGIGKYDGKNFTHYTDKEGTRLNFVRGMTEDKTGNLWFTSGDGITKYDGRNFIYYTVIRGLSGDWTSDVHEDKSGQIWIATIGAGLFRFNGKSFTNFSVKEGLVDNNVNSIQEDKSGDLWFATDGGVCTYDGISFAHFTEKDGLINNRVIAIREDKSGNLWFATGGGVCKYDRNSFTHFTEKEGLSSNNVLSILEDENGILWFGTAGGGVSKYDRNNFTHFTQKEGFNNYEVWAILQDKTGNLWFGTGGGGISRYDGNNFIHFANKDGLTVNRATCILEDKNGDIWFSIWAGGVSRYDGKSITHFTEKDGLIHALVWTMFEDKTGNLWFGTYTGISKYDGTSFTSFSDKEGLGYSDIKTILQDKNGHLWFGGTGGVSEFDGERFTHFSEKEGLPDNFDISLSILEDKKGNIWFGSAGGVSKYDGMSFTNFTEKEGLGHNVVLGIAEDKTGNLWFGTRAGITRYDGDSLTNFTEKQGLVDDDVQSLMLDRSGNLWIGSGSGLSVLEKDRLSLYDTRAPGEQLSNHVDSLFEAKTFFRNYTYEDGFSGIGVNYGKTICEARDGAIWVGADDRLTVFHPKEETADTIPPNIQLTGLALFNENIAWQNLEEKKDTAIVLGNGVLVHDFHFDGLSKWYGLPENLTLAYNNNYLTFQFAGVTIASPKKVKYQYKLEGLDENWSALTTRTEAPYGNLPQGKYTFKVKAMNGDGYWSKEFHYSFTIRPPWWRTWWAYCIYGLLLIAAAWTIYHYQKKRITRREQEKIQQKERAHAKEIEKAYNELQTTQAQLIQSEKMASLGELTAGIAHEIQNPLNFVNNFSEVNKELLAEMKDEIVKGNYNEAATIAKNVIDNQEKINYHGKRADEIVKGMLQHSRATSGQKELTDINVLADEYLRLAYHGLRAKNKSFNAKLETNFDTSIEKINIVPQEIGRVILNLINNAFYAVSEKQKQNIPGYEPTVKIITRNAGDKAELRVIDNGNGIPQKVLDKIFQPFFTTKPAGQGTGLGLSLAYDIIKFHGGEIKVISKEGEETEFLMLLPIVN